jgi:nitrogen-specific signal transduction histidine kinase
VSARALRFENRDAVQVIARDVSQREKLEEQLRQAQKMEAVGQFAGGIAHDFNNMLTAISGHNDFLLRSLPPGQQHDDAEEIQRAATRAAELVKQLLAFGRRQVLQPVVVDLNEEVLSMRSMLGRLLGGNIEIDLHLGDDLGTVKVDPVQVEQVLMNLAANARDSMPRGGRILIETRNTEITKAQRSEDADLEPGAYVTLVFTDTGVGMDEPIRARIFDPFFTTKDRFEGTGLGLSTVYGIVTQSGGAISVESDPGCGSTFTIHLPRCDEVREAARTESGDEVPGGRETLLVAEDDPAVRRLTVRFLTDAGYHVLEAANGSEALEVAEGWDAPIHLLLTDVVMPELGGGELTGRIKTSHPETRVLYVSGYPDDAIGNHGILAHETSFLPKPFTSEGLTAKVREVLDGD